MSEAPISAQLKSPLDGVIALARQAAVHEAVTASFHGGVLTQITRLTGGLSLGSVFRITVGGQSYVLRLDEPKKGLRDPARQYACLKIAAAAGVAPNLIYCDATERVVITDFIQVENQTHSRAARLEALTAAVKTLHAAPLFPRVMAYLDVMDILIAMFKGFGVVPDEAVAEPLALYRELTAVYPRRDPDLVSSHNDLNPNNILFQGSRPWFVDWETAFAADRYVDIAAIANFYAADEAAEEILLRQYFGAALDEYRRARFFLMQQVNRIFYGVALLNIIAIDDPKARLTAADLAPDSNDLNQAMVSVTTPAGQARFAGTCFAQALQHMKSQRFRDAMAIVKNNPVSP